MNRLSKYFILVVTLVALIIGQEASAQATSTDACNQMVYNSPNCHEEDRCDLCYKFWFVFNRDNPLTEGRRQAGCRRMASVLQSLRTLYSGQCIRFKAETKFVSVNQHNPGITILSDGTPKISNVGRFAVGMMEKDFKVNRLQKLKSRCIKVIVTGKEIDFVESDGTVVPANGYTGTKKNGIFMADDSVTAISADGIRSSTEVARTVMHETLHVARNAVDEEFDDHQFDSSGARVSILNVMGDFGGTLVNSNQLDLLKRGVCIESDS